MSVVDESVETLDVRYRALVDVAGVLASHVELQDLLHNLRTLLDPLIHFEFLAVYLRDDESNTITLRLREPQRLPSDGPPVSYSLDDSLPGIACRTGKSLYVARVEAGGPPPSDRLIQYNIASACAVPLTTPRRSLGVLTFGSHDENAYTPADIEFMERVGALVAVAVENALSLDTIREQRVALESERDRLGLLLDVTNAVVSELDTRTLFRAVAPALRRCCSADTASLTLYDAGGGEASQARVRCACQHRPLRSAGHTVDRWHPVGARVSHGRGAHLFRGGAERVSRLRADAPQWHQIGTARCRSSRPRA